MERNVKTLAEDELLRKTLLSHAGAELESWVAALRPTPMHETPHSLLTSLADFSNTRLDRVELPLVRSPTDLPWVPLPPLQRKTEGAPLCHIASDMLLPEGWARLTVWVEAQVADLLHIEERLGVGTAPELIQTAERPRPITIGQSEFQPWARGVVWDCRQECCKPLDFSEIPGSGLNSARMAEWWHRYPDQTLLSYLLEGVRLDADVWNCRWF